jgi:hypothetical protein
MKKKKVTLKTVRDLGNKIRKGKPFVGECIDRNTGKIIDLKGRLVKKLGKKGK